MRTSLCVSMSLAMVAGAAYAGGPSFHGAGWMQFGRVENSFVLPNNPNNYDENLLGGFGGIITTTLSPAENWEAGLGMGSLLVHLSRGSFAEAGIWYPFWVGFVSEARLTYSNNFAENLGLQLTLGAAPYNYSRDSKNLGAYLLKGYVYPGAIASGFGDLFGVPSTRTGILGRLKAGAFTNDLMVNIETEDKPLYDISFADVAEWRVHSSFEFGAGVNFYRFLAADDELTSPEKDCPKFQTTFSGSGPGGDQNSHCLIFDKDATGKIDTLTGSLSGIKLMARFRLDPKVWFGLGEILGADELVLYGEAALLGVKDYEIFYDDKLRRIPVMLGFNLPTFKLFNLSVEGEYYASKHSSDNLAAQNGSWLPSGVAGPGKGRDDWKWSVNASKVAFGNIFFGLQVANDHLRLGGTHNSATGREAMNTPQDWYWAFKSAYFF